MTEYNKGGALERKMPEMMLVPIKEYNELKERDATLSKLEAAGVDNWEGYSDALKGTWDD